MEEQHLRAIKNILWVLIAGLAIYVLEAMAPIILPLVLAIFIALMLQPAMDWLLKRKVPFAAAMSIVLLFSLSVIWMIGSLAFTTGRKVAQQKDKYIDLIEIKIKRIVTGLNDIPGVEFELGDLIERFSEAFSVEKLVEGAETLMGAVGDFTTSFFMMMLYLFAILGGTARHNKYLGSLYEDDRRSKLLLGNFERLKKSLVTYMKVKTLVSLLTGATYALICYLFGIDFPIFWGFVAFVLNYIPTVGSIMATLPPLAMGLITLDTGGQWFALAGCLIGAQVFFGNILEPKLQGESLALNVVTVIFALVFWGYLWGLAGMLLSVPLTVGFKMFLEQNPDFRVVARLMAAPTED